jgi:ubiquinone/menaquinone biosynthesis C-methylase UbiE
MARRQPGLTGAVYDLKDTLTITKELITRNKMEHAVGTIEGDFITDDLGCGFDLVLMSSIIHIYSPAENKTVVKKGYRALKPGGKIVIRDFFLDPSGASPMHAALFSVNMLVNTDTGSSYRESEVRSWLKQAGFVKIKRVDASPRLSFIEGVKPEKK